MTIDEAMKDVRGMLASIRYEETRPRQREWMLKGGFQWIIDPHETRLQDYTPMRPWRVDAKCLPELLEATRTNPYAHEAAETLARMHLRQGKPLPEPLAEFVLDWMDAPPKRKKKESPRIRARDEFLAMLVGYLKRQAGVAPTRGRDISDRNSGCDLVVQALSERGQNLSYSAVESAWARYGGNSER